MSYGTDKFEPYATSIYWLCDTSVAGWPKGEPFYCGKTINPTQRLQNHLACARRGNRPGNRSASAIRIAKCPLGALRMEIVAIVPPFGGWEAREQHWIKQLWQLNPTGCVNIDLKGCDIVRPRPERGTFEDFARSRFAYDAARLERDRYEAEYQQWREQQYT